ncbi:hypothetical protein M595_4336 [Lyngbya aestuarii BL J]|uniref:Uncharacterized protein n=1 Tax=Lyngbya aestuarii BL J TaxID=1348334 RepID=U7QCW8_9CYAN|nr:hypothetical protein [Lyngbya aestuarii]ERT05714.1 hypothetical protein M595_4336 [Lyngbya aestuarii BL J]
MGEVYFQELKAFVQTSEKEDYGELNINCAKYVHESQWYMEDQEVIATFNFG